MKNITVLGVGRWASCIAYLLDQKKYNIIMWQRTQEPESTLFSTHKNEFVTLSKRVNFTHDLARAIDGADLVIISILSQALQNLMDNLKKVKGYNKKFYCINMKGIEASTGRRLSEILRDAGIPRQNIAVWVGPGHVQSISKGGTANMLVSAYNDKLAQTIAKNFSSKTLNLSTSSDIVGTELGAAAKNVYGIAAGILTASGEYEHCLGALMVASIMEMSNLIDAMGGKRDSAHGLALLGDYQATMFDDNSKNLSYGKAIITYNTLDDKVLLKHLTTTRPEGYKTCEALLLLRDRYNDEVSDSQKISMPIAAEINNIITGKTKLNLAAGELFKTISEVLKNN